MQVDQIKILFFYKVLQYSLQALVNYTDQPDKQSRIFLIGMCCVLSQVENDLKKKMSAIIMSSYSTAEGG